MHVCLLKASYTCSALSFARDYERNDIIEKIIVCCIPLPWQEGPVMEDQCLSD